MVGRYLVLTKEYASAKTQAVTPDPQEKTKFSSKFFDISWNNLFKSSLFLKVLFSFITSTKGKHTEFGIEPLLTFFLGSGALPSNLSLLRASTTLNSFLEIFWSIKTLFFTSLVNSLPS